MHRGLVAITEFVPALFTFVHQMVAFFVIHGPYDGEHRGWYGWYIFKRQPAKW